jgi:hypothetical protein
MRVYYLDNTDPEGIDRVFEKICELAKAVQADTEDIFHVLTHLSAPRGKVVRHSGDRPSEDTFVLE